MGRRFFASLIFGFCAFYCAGSNFSQAATIIGGSDLMSAADANKIVGWIGAGPLLFENIFDKAPGDDSFDFHAAADGKGPTVFLAHVSYSGGEAVIGGYNPKSWNSSGEGTNADDLADRTAVIFNLTRKVRYVEIDDSVGRYQTFNNHIFGPTFGDGLDIFIGNDLIVGYVSAYSYCASKGEVCFAGPDILGLGGFIDTDIKVGALEVFTVSPIPVPAALPLFASALAGLGFIRWRKRRRGIGVRHRIAAKITSGAESGSE